MTTTRRAAPLAVLGIVVALLCRAPAAAWASFGSATPAQSATYATLQVAAPTGVTATASCGPVGSLQAKVTLGWTASTTSRVTGYGIERRIVPAASTEVATTSSSATTYTDTALLTATTYSYVVRAYVGSWYAGSTEVSATTPAVCT